MVRNELTGALELNLQDTGLMFRIDQALKNNNTCIVEVNDEDCVITRDRAGYVALVTFHGVKKFGFNTRVASGAFLDLMDKLVN